MSTITERKEKNCTWHFERQGGTDKGLKDARFETFKKYPYAGLIRESIQNSLDAVKDKNQPVKVVYEFKKLKQSNYPSFFKLFDHIKACKLYYKQSENDSVFKNMIDTLSDNTLRYIKISDYNTCGMDYKGEYDTSSRFYGFVRSSGVSNKEQLSGGSFGLGKGAYIGISSLHTFLVSTMTPDNKYCFEGVSNLTTHRFKESNGNEEKKAPEGFYDNNNGRPITDPELIPEQFIRSEPGTDILIMGYGNYNEFNKNTLGELSSIKNEMAIAVLRNFWVAIAEKRLEVKIDHYIINASTLENCMKNFFYENKDTHNKKEYCPKPYYETYTSILNKQEGNYKLFINDIPSLGRCELYLSAKTSEPKLKVIKMRGPRMYITRDSFSGYEGYGVFICTGETGNEFLRSLEPPTHDDWSLPAKSTNKELYKKAKQVLSDINDFIKISVQEFYPENKNSMINVEGLDEYLYITDSLLDNEDLVSTKLKDIGKAKVSKEKSKRETSADKYRIKKVQNVKIQMDDITPKGDILAEETANVDFNKDGEDDIFVNQNEYNTNKSIKPSEGEKLKKGTIEEDDDSNKIRIKIPITFRSIAQRINNQIKHIIFIYVNKDYKNCELIMKAVGDDSETTINIKHSSEGYFNNGYLKGISLIKGKNKIEVEFEDDLTHSLTIIAHEIK